MPVRLRGCTCNAPTAPQTQCLHASGCKCFILFHVQIFYCLVLVGCECNFSYLKALWCHFQSDDIPSVTDRHHSYEQCGARTWAQFSWARSHLPNNIISQNFKNVKLISLYNNIPFIFECFHRESFRQNLTGTYSSLTCLCSPNDTLLHIPNDSGNIQTRCLRMIGDEYVYH